MTDWTHKRLLEKLDRMQAQRDRLLAVIELMAAIEDVKYPLTGTSEDGGDQP